MIYVKRKHKKSASEDALFYYVFGMIYMAEAVNNQS